MAMRRLREEDFPEMQRESTYQRRLRDMPVTEYHPPTDSKESFFNDEWKQRMATWEDEEDWKVAADYRMDDVEEITVNVDQHIYRGAGYTRSTPFVWFVIQNFTAMQFKRYIARKRFVMQYFGSRYLLPNEIAVPTGLFRVMFDKMCLLPFGQFMSFCHNADTFTGDNDLQLRIEYSEFDVSVENQQDRHVRRTVLTDLRWAANLKISPANDLELIRTADEETFLTYFFEQDRAFVRSIADDLDKEEVDANAPVRHNYLQRGLKNHKTEDIYWTRFDKLRHFEDDDVHDLHYIDELMFVDTETQGIFESVVVESVIPMYEVFGFIDFGVVNEWYNRYNDESLARMEPIYKRRLQEFRDKEDREPEHDERLEMLKSEFQFKMMLEKAPYLYQHE